LMSRWAIDGVGKGLGGSFLSDAHARHSGNPPDDTLLRDTAKELEQLFDEFQSLRNSITQSDSEALDAISPSPSPAATGGMSPHARLRRAPDEQSRHEVQDTRRYTVPITPTSPQGHIVEDLHDTLKASEERSKHLVEQLQASQDQVHQLEHAQQQQKESRAAAARSREQQHSMQAANLAVARRYEKDNTKKLTKQAPLLEVLNTLEADGETQQKEISELEKEVRTLRKAIRDKDKVIESTTDEVEELLRQPEDLPALHNDIKMLLHTIEGLQEENKTLVRIQHAKTQAIEELSGQLQAHEQDEDVITQLQNQTKVHEAREKDLIAELNTLKLAEEKRTKQLLREGTEDLALTAQEWVEERRFLKAQVKKLSEENANHERLNKAQGTRVKTLQDRINHITDVLKDARARRMPSSLLVHAPSLSNVQQATTHEARMAEEAGQDLVPVEMYHFLEVEIQAVRAELREKSMLLLERDDLVEGLERKMDVLTRTRATETKRRERDACTMRADLEESRVRCTRLEDELRKKENELRSFTLQAKTARRKATS